jgi:hypothetical protein
VDVRSPTTTAVIALIAGVVWALAVTGAIEMEVSRSACSGRVRGQVVGGDQRRREASRGSACNPITLGSLRAELATGTSASTWGPRILSAPSPRA